MKLPIQISNKIIKILVLSLLFLTSCSPIKDYYDTKPENIVKDEATGVEFVNNELCITLYDNSDKKYLNEIGKIVSQMEFANSYQIQLDKTYSYSELKSLQKELEEKYSDIIEDITLNVAIFVAEE